MHSHCLPLSIEAAHTLAGDVTGYMTRRNIRAWRKSAVAHRSFTQRWPGREAKRRIDGLHMERTHG
jgi:hypothetical protein